ncbi:putative basic helix-loop-helix protein BHLH22 [Sesbania bispinosa]|nr:putative basic helix-loop-helix protein BHLH22 [Sesbania bispinosa]
MAMKVNIVGAREAVHQRSGEPQKCQSLLVPSSENNNAKRKSSNLRGSNDGRMFPFISGVILSASSLKSSDGGSVRNPYHLDYLLQH